MELVFLNRWVGRDTLLGLEYLLCVAKTCVFCSSIVIYGSPNCVLSCFGGRQLPNVENHCYRLLVIDKKRKTIREQVNVFVIDNRFKVEIILFSAVGQRKRIIPSGTRIRSCFSQRITQPGGQRWEVLPEVAGHGQGRPHHRVSARHPRSQGTRHPAHRSRPRCYRWKFCDFGTRR